MRKRRKLMIMLLLQRRKRRAKRKKMERRRGRINSVMYKIAGLGQDTVILIGLYLLTGVVTINIVSFYTFTILKYLL